MENNIDYKRQALIFKPDDFETKTVSIIGLGNIGSHTALGLARLGLKKFVLFDHDKVENHNLSSQAFPFDSLGKEKVVAISEEMKRISNSNILEIPQKFNVDDEVGDIIIIAVDSMDARKNICKQLKANGSDFDLLIDGRIGGSQLEVYTVKSLEEWKKTFVDKASSDPCGGRYVCYTSMIIGGIITNIVKKHLKKEKLNRSLVFNIDTLEIIKNFDW